MDDQYCISVLKDKKEEMECVKPKSEFRVQKESLHTFFLSYLHTKESIVKTSGHFYPVQSCTDHIYVI